MWLVALCNPRETSPKYIIEKTQSQLSNCKKKYLRQNSVNCNTTEFDGDGGGRVVVVVVECDGGGVVVVVPPPLLYHHQSGDGSKITVI